MAESARDHQGDGHGELIMVSNGASPANSAAPTDSLVATVLIDPSNPTFHECKSDNDSSPVVTASCIQ
jgi:hypothetical protein